MKKQLLLFVMMLLPMVASAHDIEVQNGDGVTIYYKYTNNYTELEVTYRGTTWDEYSDEYTGNVVIPEEVTFMNRTRKVTKIGDEAFRSCSGLTSVTIPNSVTSIGDYAFYYCSRLTSITIPNSVTSIGRVAFYKCSGLTSVTIPNSVTSIGDGAFFLCSGLTSITMPNSVTSIGNNAFYGCSGLTSVTIPNSVTSIDSQAFDGCDIPTVISLIENPFGIYGKSSYYRIFSINTFNNATLYVPKGTIDKYKATEGWKDFVFIEEGISNGVADIPANAVLIQGEGGTIKVHGCNDGEQVSVYSINGTKAGSAVSENGSATINTTL